MTWEELRKKAEEIYAEFCFGYEKHSFGIQLANCVMYFRESGDIDIEFDIGKTNVGGVDIIRNRTYDQMYAILEALK